MSRYWGPDPNPNRPHADRLRDRTNLPAPHAILGHAVWWIATLIGFTFAALHLAAGNTHGAIPWVTIGALGTVARAVLKLEQRLDEHTNPRRVDLPTRAPATPTATVRAGSRHTRLPTPPHPRSAMDTPAPDGRSPMQP